MRAELAISAPAQDAWAVVGERFGEIGQWASAITEPVMDGPPGPGRVRTCHVAGFGPIAPGVITERLVRFDPGGRSLSYQAAGGMPRFIAHAVSRWSVHEGLSGTCLVRIDATVTLRLIARWGRSCAGGCVPIRGERSRPSLPRSGGRLRRAADRRSAGRDPAAAASGTGREGGQEPGGAVRVTPGW